MIDISALSTDELIELRAKCDQHLQKARESEKRTIWIVGDKWFNAGWFRDADFQQALELYKKEFETAFLIYAPKCASKEWSTSDLENMLPTIKAQRISETDYFNEWFPEDKEQA